MAYIGLNVKHVIILTLVRLEVLWELGIRNIKTDKPSSIYALYILNNRYACGRKYGIARNMYNGTENELLGITFYTNPSTTGYVDRRTEVQWFQPYLRAGECHRALPRPQHKNWVSFPASLHVRSIVTRASLSFHISLF